MTGTQQAAVASRIACDVVRRFGSHLNSVGRSEMAVVVANIVDMALVVFDPVPSPPGESADRHYREVKDRYERDLGGET